MAARVHALRAPAPTKDTLQALRASSPQGELNSLRAASSFRGAKVADPCSMARKERVRYDDHRRLPGTIFPPLLLRERQRSGDNCGGAGTISVLLAGDTVFF